MIFKPVLAEKVMSGEKWRTWRPGECRYREGRDYAVQPGRGKSAIGRIVVTKVTRCRCGDLTEAEARAEGFDSIDAFLAYVEALYGTADVEAWSGHAIEFELADRAEVKDAE